MFCTKCGNNLPDTAKFCDKCGATIKQSISGEKLETKQKERSLYKSLITKRPVFIGIVVALIAIISIVLVLGNGKDMSVANRNVNDEKNAEEETQVVQDVAEEIISIETLETENVENQTEQTENTEKEIIKEKEPWDPEILSLMNGYVTFGSYEQDNNLANGKEPIEWEMLDSKDGSILLISKYVLDTRKYHTNDSAVTWQTSEIRLWLNNEFLSEAFSEEEQEYILLSKIETEDNTRATAKTDGGNATEDQVFLLSEEEASFYFDGTGDYVYPTKRAGRVTGSNMAWLRSPGRKQNSAQIMKEDGSIDVEGAYVEFMPLGVRPAIWVTPNESMTSQMKAAGIEIPHIKFVERDIQIGDYVKIGRIEQNNISADGVEPIEWQILDIKDDKALILSKYILDAMPYSDSKFTGSWTKSGLRRWLNNEFYNTAFSEEEKKYVVLVKFEEKIKYGKNFYEDNIFALSSNQVKTYFNGNYDGLKWVFGGSTTEETAYVDAYVKTLPERKGSPYFTNNWWTRSLGWIGTHNDEDVYEAGVIHEWLSFFAQTEIAGVRPAMWIELSALDTDILSKGENAKATDTVENYITFGADGYVTLGAFEQDNDVSNGPEPIEWIVLEETENEMLLMSRYGLVTKNYHEDYSVLESNASVFKPEDYITWETSTIREWLNNDFYNNAFSEEEKEFLCINEIATSQYDITIDDRKEVMVEDYVYLLDSSEASKYEVKKIRIKPTEYALSQGIDNLGPNGDAPRLVRQEIGISETTESQQIITYDGKDGRFYLGEHLSHPVVCPVIKIKIN